MAQRCNDRSVVREYDPATERWEPTRDEAGEPITKPCGNWAMHGFDKCITHQRGAQSTRTKRWVQKNMPKMQDLLGELDIPDTNPMDGLLEGVRYSGAMMRALAVMVGELLERPDIVADGYGMQVQLEPGMWGLDRYGEQAPHVLMKLYDIWMERYTRCCKMALDAGIDERLVRNAEFTSHVMVEAFTLSLKAVSLTEDQRVALSKAMAENVRMLMRGKTVLPLPPS